MAAEGAQGGSVAEDLAQREGDAGVGGGVELRRGEAEDETGGAGEVAGARAEAVGPRVGVGGVEFGGAGVDDGVQEGGVGGGVVEEAGEGGAEFVGGGAFVDGVAPELEADLAAHRRVVAAAGGDVEGAGEFVIEGDQGKDMFAAFRRGEEGAEEAVGIVAARDRGGGRCDFGAADALRRRSNILGE